VIDLICDHWWFLVDFWQEKVSIIAWVPNPNWENLPRWNFTFFGELGPHAGRLQRLQYDLLVDSDEVISITVPDKQKYQCCNNVTRETVNAYIANFITNNMTFQFHCITSHIIRNASFESDNLQNG